MHIEASTGVVMFGSGSSSVAIPLGPVLAVTFRSKTGDMNGDTQVDVVNIATIISIMAGKGDDNTPGTGRIPAGMEAVDLRLPSGTKWANMDIGEEKPENYGSYFAWGETQPKDVYGWDTYQYGSSKDNVVNIGSDIAGTGYDAATATLRSSIGGAALPKGTLRLRRWGCGGFEKTKVRRQPDTSMAKYVWRESRRPLSIMRESFHQQW